MYVYIMWECVAGRYTYIMFLTPSGLFGTLVTTHESVRQTAVFAHRALSQVDIILSQDNLSFNLLVALLNPLTVLEKRRSYRKEANRFFVFLKSNVVVLVAVVRGVRKVSEKSISAF